MTRLFVKRLTVIDCSYLDARRGLVGESWQVDVELNGSLDAQGMVLDFGDVKKIIKRLIDRHFDHKLLVPHQHPGLIAEHTPDRLQLVFPLADGSTIAHTSPADAVNLIDTAHIAPDSLQLAIATVLRPELPANVRQITLHLWPEPIAGAQYQYSHGLKQHGGNCQRIAHGHRSRLEILRDGTRDTALEQAWASGWRDIYIGTRADLIDGSDDADSGYLDFAYHGAQGPFGLRLPRRACYLIDTDSTVENIAQHIADTLKARHPESGFTVFAYEGVDKGAVGQA